MKSDVPAAQVGYAGKEQVTPSSRTEPLYCKMRSNMKRVFLSPLTALSTGICLRLLFVLKLPAGAGDTIIYEQLATNWLKHGKYAMDIGGALVPVDLRVPGYPAFLALVYALTGRTREHARIFVMLAQVVVDLATCLAIGALAALLVTLGDPRAKPKRAFTAGLWLAALCPFAANYVAVPLTETWAIFLTAVAMIILVLLATLSRDEGREVFQGNGSTGKGYWTLRRWLAWWSGLAPCFARKRHFCW